MKTIPTWRKSFLLLCLFLLPMLYPTYTQADILWRNSATGQNSVWHMSGAAWPGSYDLLTTVGDPSWTIVGTGDFNADGKPDILWRNSVTGQNSVWYMNGATWNGTYDMITTVPDRNWNIVGVADFNGDGKLDLLWRNSATGQNSVWYMNGATWNGTYDMITTVPDRNWNIVGVADFNADGKPDLLWRNSATGQNSVWYMNGATWNGTYDMITTVPDRNWTIVGTRDFNGDGKPDILWRNTATGQNSVWYMNGATWNGAYDMITTVDDPNWRIVALRDAIVTGTVKAPGGVLAFYPQPGLLERIGKFFSSSAYAALSGLSNVANGTVVELVRIDDAGNTLSVIATTTVTNGTYLFNLTNLGVGYSSNLIAQVRNQSTGAKMRAFVTSETVNIDPTSESTVRVVLEKITATSGALASFTVQELTDLASGMDFLTTIKQAGAGANLEATVTTVKNLLAADASLTAFLTAAAVPGQTTEVPGDVGDYFPVTNGNRWEATVTGWGTGQPTTTYTDIVQITGTTVVNGVSTLVFQESDPARGVLGEDYRTKTSAGITYYGNNVASDTITPLIAPYMEAIFPLHAGSSFEQINKAGLDYGVDYDGDGSHETFSAYYTVTVAGFESVTVDAGIFNNCLKLQTTFRVAVFPTRYPILQITLTGTLTEWYASGVGPVKKHLDMQSVSYLNPHFTENYYEDYVLVAYRADGRSSTSVLSAKPTNGTLVGGASEIYAIFNKDMNAASVNSSTFAVKDSGNNQMAGTVSYQSQNKKAIFTPTLPLPSGTYTATISTNAQDSNGFSLASPYSWSFMVDSTGPSVVYISPVNNATGVGIGTSITATFSEDMNPSTIDYSSFLVWNTGTGHQVGGSVTYSNGTATFTGYLERGTTYSVTVKSSVKDMAGNALPSDYSWAFTTAGPGLFLPSVAKGGDSRGEAVAIGDMNNDGLNDVVMVSCVSDPIGAIDVFLQDGSGGLASPLQYVASTGCYGTVTLAIGDVNHDGRNDVVVGSYGPSIQVFLQNASGGLDPGITYTTDDSIIVRIGDLNNDGLMDIVGIGRATNTVSIWYQNNGGGLNSPVTYPVSHSGWQHGGTDDLALGDVNNDGRTDIIVMNGDSRTDIALGILTQKEDGTFNQAVYYNRASTYGRTAVAVGDLNGDNLNDVALYSQDSPNSKIAVFTQNAQGGLNPSVSYDSYTGGVAIQVADVNGDSLKDVIVVHPNSYYVGVSLQKPDGTLGAEDLYRYFAGNYSTLGLMAIGDINDDSLNDVAMATTYSGLTVLYHTPLASGLTEPTRH